MSNIYRILFSSKSALNPYNLLFKLKRSVSYDSQKLNVQTNISQQTQSQMLSLWNPNSDEGEHKKQTNIQLKIQILKTINAQSQETHFQVGKVLMRQGKYRSAITQLSKGWKINQCNSIYCFRIAICLMKTNNFMDAIKLLQRQVSRNPTDLSIYHYLAVANFHIENYRQSILCFYKCYANNSKISSLIVDFGKDLLKKQQYDEALLFFLKLFIHMPQDRSIIIGLKECFVFGQKIQLGKEIYAILGELQILKEAVNYSLGLFNFQIGNVKESKEYLLCGIRLNQDDFLVNLYLGTVYLQQQSLQQAIFYYSRSLDMQPKNTSVLNSLAMVFLKQKNFQNARLYYLKSLQINENDSLALSGIGILCFYIGDIQKGIKYLEKAIEIDELNYAALEKLATAYYLLGDQQRGKRLYQKAEEVRRSMEQQN